MSYDKVHVLDCDCETCRKNDEPPKIRKTKGYVLSGNCSTPKCKKRSIQAIKIPLGSPCWWESCTEHTNEPVVLSSETMAKLGHVEGE